MSASVGGLRRNVQVLTQLALELLEVADGRSPVALCRLGGHEAAMGFLVVGIGGDNLGPALRSTQELEAELDELISNWLLPLEVGVGGQHLTPEAVEDLGAGAGSPCQCRSPAFPEQIDIHHDLGVRPQAHRATPKDHRVGAGHFADAVGDPVKVLHCLGRRHFRPKYVENLLAVQPGAGRERKQLDEFGGPGLPGRGGYGPVADLHPELSQKADVHPQEPSCRR